MSSHLTSIEVARIAELARLELAPGEAETFARQLTSILDYAARVQEIDTTQTSARAAGDPGASTWRDDVVTPGLGRSTVLDAAPDADVTAGLFRVPKVLQP